MKKPLLLLPLLLLTGCVPIAQHTPPEPASPDCITVSEDAVAGIQWGLDEVQDDVTASEAAAIAVDTGWTVAATLEGPGMDGTIGVWHTLQNPTATGTFAYTSAEGIAAEFSSYVRADAEGVAEAKGCLN